MEKKVHRTNFSYDSPTIDIDLDNVDYFDQVKLEAKMTFEDEVKYVHRIFSLAELDE